uniref:Uncharacterized protein n=2 Tax=Oryza meridionalis TaxID=40149 RepID=A0A0E0BZT1_9ORYZ
MQWPGWAVGAAIGHPQATVTAMLLGIPLCTLMSTIVCRLVDTAKQSLITVGVPTPQDMGLPDQQSLITAALAQVNY